MDVVLLIFAPVATAAIIGGGIWLFRDRLGLFQSKEERKTGERLARVEGILEELQRGSAAPPEGSSPSETAALAAQATERTEGLLAEAVALQDDNKEREAIEKLLTAYDEDMPALAKAQLHLLAGNGYIRLSEYDPAEHHYEASLEAGRAAESAAAEADALAGQGLVSRYHGDLQKAEEHQQKALAIYRETGNQLGEAAQLGNLGVVFALQGDLPKAEDHFQEAFAIDRETGNKPGEAYELNNLGNVYALQADLPKAEDHYHQALAIDRESGNQSGEARTLGNLGNVYREQGDLAKAEGHLMQALYIHREIGDRLGEAIQLGNLGLLFAALNEPAKACQQLEEALSIFNEIGASMEADKATSQLQRLGCDEAGGSRTEDAPTG